MENKIEYAWEIRMQTENKWNLTLRLTRALWHWLICDVFSVFHYRNVWKSRTYLYLSYLATHGRDEFVTHPFNFEHGILVLMQWVLARGTLRVQWTRHITSIFITIDQEFSPSLSTVFTYSFIFIFTYFIITNIAILFLWIIW